MKAKLARIAGLAFAFAAMLAVALVAAPGRAEATVSSCTLTTAGIAFSPYNTQTRAAVDGTGTITVECFGNQNNNTVSIHLTGGISTTCVDRTMRSGTNNLVYNLFRSAARSGDHFCNGLNRVELVFDLRNGGRQTQTITVYGRVNASQNPIFSSTPYTDSLTATARSGTSSTGSFLGSTVFDVSGSVAAICSVSAGTLGFGAYSGTSVNATAAVSVSCTSGAPYQIAMGGGSNQSGSARRMAGPASNFLTYQLYSDSARVTLWGDGSAQLGARHGGTGSGSAQSLTVYGRIPAGQSPAAGSYSDSVTVTIEY